MARSVCLLALVLVLVVGGANAFYEDADSRVIGLTSKVRAMEGQREGGSGGRQSERIHALRGDQDAHMKFLTEGVGRTSMSK